MPILADQHHIAFIRDGDHRHPFGEFQHMIGRYDMAILALAAIRAHRQELVLEGLVAFKSLPGFHFSLNMVNDRA